MGIMKIKILIIAGIFLIISYGLSLEVKDKINVDVDNVNYNFSNINTEKVYKIWSETSFRTDINSLAYQELAKRGYWDKDKREENKKAIEIFNKYNND